ncbi:MAG: SprT-like domain-containing protein [Thermaurantimonas sp.]|uniref:SprT-like domain-containing protein n=1 Tax=Thermaurantimonas sp. TaxID=2681568 RepID=UPI00391D6BB3
MSAKPPVGSPSLWVPLAKYLPDKAYHYVEGLLNQHTIFLKITKPKRSRAGLYFFDEKRGRHAIYINGNLDKYNFLITLIHEYAHLVARSRYGKAIKPHGPEWKSTFRELMKPLLHTDIFPPAIITYLRSHMANPAATHFRDKALIEAIDRYISHAQSVLGQLKTHNTPKSSR